MSSPVIEFVQKAYAPSTLRAYSRALRQLQDWLTETNNKLDDPTLASYLECKYRSGLSQSECGIIVAAVNASAKDVGAHSPAGRTTELVLKGIRRSPKHGAGQVDGLTWDLVDRIVKLQQRKGTPAGLRNAALIALGSELLLRPSEIQAVEIEDLDMDHQCGATLYIPRSKTDQERNGEKRDW